MTKLSQALKSVINAPSTRPGTIPAPPNITSVYRSVAEDSKLHNVGLKPWFSAVVSRLLAVIYSKFV